MPGLSKAHPGAPRRLVEDQEGCDGTATPYKIATHRAVCATCLRPLDIWPDGVRHRDARFDLACFPEHHEAKEL